MKQPFLKSFFSNGSFLFKTYDEPPCFYLWKKRLNMSDSAIIIEKTSKLLLDLKKKYGEQTEWINTLQQKLNATKQLNVCGKVYQNLAIQCLNSKQYQEANASSKTAISIFTKIDDTENAMKCKQLRSKSLVGLARTVLTGFDSNTSDKSKIHKKIIEVIGLFEESMDSLCSSSPDSSETLSLRFEYSQLLTCVFLNNFDDFRKSDNLRAEQMPSFQQIALSLEAALKGWDSCVSAEVLSTSNQAQERKLVAKNTIKLLSEIAGIYELIPQRLSALSLLEIIDVDTDARFILADQLLSLGFASAAQLAFKFDHSPVSSSESLKEKLISIRVDLMRARLLINPMPWDFEEVFPLLPF